LTVNKLNACGESIPYLLPIPKDQRNSRLKYDKEKAPQNPIQNAVIAGIVRNT